jgi:hypothetical protein
MPKRALDSRFKFDTEVGGKNLDWGSVAEALSGYSIQVPDHVVAVGIGVFSEAGLAKKVVAEAAVGILDRSALPRAVRIAEVSAQADGVLDGFVSGELAAVVVRDGAARAGGEPAQFFGDGIGGKFGILGGKTPGQGQPGAPFLQRQENVALTAEVHQMALPIAELAAQVGLGRPLMDRHAVWD